MASVILAHNLLAILVAFAQHMDASVVTHHAHNIFLPRCTTAETLPRPRMLPITHCNLSQSLCIELANAQSDHHSSDSFHTDIITAVEKLYHHAQDHIDALCIIPQSLLVDT